MAADEGIWELQIGSGEDEGKRKEKKWKNKKEWMTCGTSG